jgi:Bacterial Ig-like domain (group 2)/Abnormal spindle-like microcephaly-assoc'd, ASPM-SPD-2-Hydin
MRMVRVFLFIILAVIFSLIGISPRKIRAQQGASQPARNAQASRHSRRKPHIRVTSVKPAVIPGATGLISIPVDTDDKQIPVTGGPGLTIPLFNASTTNTITISSVTIDPSSTGTFTVTTNCTTLSPGASCNVVVTFNSPVVCADAVAGPIEGLIDVANNDPVLDGALLQIGVEGYGSDGNFQFKSLTDPTLTAQQLANQLVGGGVQISNVVYTGAAVAAGTFSTASNIIGFNNGVILSTGSIRNVIGPNCATGITAENETAGDTDLDTLVGTGHTTNDAAVLEFDFVPKTSTLTFSYVFASDEYNEFVGQFNDVFGFFVNGNNIALLPNVTPPTPVSINTVNLNANTQFFRNNDVQFPGTVAIDTEMDGLTVVLTATAQVTANQTNHMKLAIGDADDFAVDSNVFIEAGSLSSSTLTFNPTSVNFGNQPVNTTSGKQPITVTNTGTAAVNITSLVASAGFGETDNCVGALPASGTCTIQATFTPTTATAFNGTIVVTDDAADSPQSVALSGTGTSSGPTLVSIAVMPGNATIGVNATQQFTATGTFSDNSTKDVTGQSTWTSSAPATATVGAATGLATGVAAGGPVTITATDGTIKGTAQLTVTSGPTLKSIAVTPSTANIGVNGMQPFTATGTFSDNSTKDVTTQSTWKSSNTEVATVGAGTGIATGVGVGGPVTITATDAGISGTAQLTVSNVPFTLTINPPPGGVFGPVAPGGTLPVGVILTALPGTTGTVTFGCTTSSPTITCSPQPSTVALSPNGPLQVAIVVNTFCKGPVTTGYIVPPGGLGGGIGLLLLSTMLAGTAWKYRRNPRWAVSFALFVVIALGGVACNSLPRNPNGVTLPGNYQLFITATFNGQTVSAPAVNFVVN